MLKFDEDARRAHGMVAAATREMCRLAACLAVREKAARRIQTGGNPSQR
jgi:hypothetical protein